MTKTEAEETKKRFNAISRDRAVTAEMANDYAFALGYLEAFSLAERMAEVLIKISDEAAKKTMDTVQLEYWLMETCEEALADFEKACSPSEEKNTLR